MVTIVRAVIAQQRVFSRYSPVESQVCSINNDFQLHREVELYKLNLFFYKQFRPSKRNVGQGGLNPITQIGGPYVPRCQN